MIAMLVNASIVNEIKNIIAGAKEGAIRVVDSDELYLPSEQQLIAEMKKEMERLAEQ
jgi:hypothetical protein